MTQLADELRQIEDEMLLLADEMAKLVDKINVGSQVQNSKLVQSTQDSKQVQPSKPIQQVPPVPPTQLVQPSKPIQLAQQVPLSQPSKFPNWVLETASRLRLNYSVFETAPDSHYSCLMPWGINQTQTIFRKECVIKPKTIIDANANIGCDTAHFAYMFPEAKITAIEMSVDTAALLQKNVSRFSQYARAPMGKVDCVQADCLDYLKNVKADMVYFDPPWCASANSSAANSSAANSAAPLRPPRIELSLSGKPRVSGPNKKTSPFS